MPSWLFPTQFAQLRFDAATLVKFAPLPENEFAITLPLIVWFPLNVLLPPVTATPYSLTVWISDAELGWKRVVLSGVYCAVIVSIPIPMLSESSAV
jgi:hypothetical protein